LGKFTLSAQFSVFELYAKLTNINFIICFCDFRFLKLTLILRDFPILNLTLILRDFRFLNLTLILRDFPILNLTLILRDFRFLNLTLTLISLKLFFKYLSCQHELPSLKCSEEDCIADFVIRRETRLKYPGACSLEFQSVMDIFTSCLLKWDTNKKTSTGRGILGTVRAFFAADEEQGRKTLHRHWQIWTKEMNQTLRNALFDNNPSTMMEARKTFIEIVDSTITTSYGPQLFITHNCVDDKNQETTKVDTPENIFKEKDPDCFRQARHKELCNDVKGNIMFCQDCNTSISTTAIITQSLNRWRELVLPGTRAQDKRPDTKIPLSIERLDMAAYLHSYHMKDGCATESDPFWGNKNIRDILLKYRFEEHSASHAGSCFKKGCECRFFFPFMSCTHTYIHEDRGVNNENKTTRHCLDGTVNYVYPFMVITKRPMGCQFINSHNTAISEVFNFNTNIQIGDSSQVFYSTLYTSKSTQDEDSEKQLVVGRAVIKRMKRLLEEKQLNESNQITTDPSFVEGLCRVLSGLNAATSRYVVSTPLAHLIICKGGSRFTCSADVSNLLVTQLEAVLEGQATMVRIRTSKVPGADVRCWCDSLADDYIYRPTKPELEDICFYEMTSKYKKEYKKHKTGSIDTAEFCESHPGHAFSRLRILKIRTIPMMSLPRDKLCPMEELDLGNTKPAEQSHDKREMYAKMALLMFYPFRTLNDLKRKDSYWKLFNKERLRHIQKRKNKFWSKGFEILQNIEDRSNIQKKLKRARDPISMETINKQPNDNKKNTNDTNEEQIADILDMGKQLRLVFC